MKKLNEVQQKNLRVLGFKGKIENIEDLINILPMSFTIGGFDYHFNISTAKNFTHGTMLYAVGYKGTMKYYDVHYCFDLIDGLYDTVVSLVTDERFSKAIDLTKVEYAKSRVSSDDESENKAIEGYIRYSVECNASFMKYVMDMAEKALTINDAADSAIIRYANLISAACKIVNKYKDEFNSKNVEVEDVYNYLRILKQVKNNMNDIVNSIIKTVDKIAQDKLNKQFEDSFESSKHLEEILGDEKED